MVVYQNGRIKLNGQFYDSPFAAGKAAPEMRDKRLDILASAQGRRNSHAQQVAEAGKADKEGHGTMTEPARKLVSIFRTWRWD
ncbi:MAG: hypothetical protein IID41_02920 [Planctomycetes bacterium]|nr:hypothetical protein [Planctomycetota bacterium]